jgi:hypothetical protein
VLRFRTVLVAAFLGAVFLAVLAGFAACAGTGGSSSFTVRTGVIIRAESLTTGRGCGPNPGQVFKYAAVIFGQSKGGGFRVPITGNVYDCFADGAFLELPLVNGSNQYRLEIRAFNRAAFDDAREKLAGLTNLPGPKDAGFADDPQGSSPELEAFESTVATWTTTCTATQLPAVQSLAVCDGLEAPGPSRVIVATMSFPLEEGGIAACATPPDAGADAGADASDAGGAQVTFSVVRARTRTSSSDGGASPQRDVACPEPFVETFPPEPQNVTIDVVLLGGAAGGEVGRTTCTGETRPGVTVAAKCDPVR